MALIDFTLSNARRFYLSMENPLGVKGLKVLENCSRCWKVLEICCQFYPTKLLKCLRRKSAHCLLWASDVTLYWLDFAPLESLKNGKMCPWKALKSPWIFDRKKCMNPAIMTMQVMYMKWIIWTAEMKSNESCLILAVMNAIICNCVKKPEKNSGLQPRSSIPLKSWIFFRLLCAIAYNCIHNCEDQPSFDLIMTIKPTTWFSIGRTQSECSVSWCIARTLKQLI